MAWAWRICFCAGALVSVVAVADPQPSGSIRFMEPYIVEGLAVGVPVAPDSWQYKRFNCTPSTQYANSTWCTFSETKGGVTKVLTIMHLYDNIVTYINKQISPASFTNSEVEREIGRLSSQFNSSPHIYRSPNRPGLPGGIIATWGGIELQPLSPNDLTILEQGKSPNPGVLVDYLMDFHASARAGLPVYSLSGGGAGYVWIAKFDKKGKEKLRFFAADPSRMKRSQPDDLPETNGGPFLHAVPVPTSGCAEYTVTVHDYGQVRGKPSLSGRPLWRLVAGSNVTICAKDITTDESNIPWIWVQFKSLEEPWHHEGYISFRLLQAFVPPVVPTLPSRPPPEANKPEVEKSVSLGTGFFVSPEGHIITNAHVIVGCDAPQVTSGVLPTVSARVLARDLANDLALLKSELRSKAAASLRTGVRVGEDIEAFGYPLFGLLATGGNFTVGNVSAIAGLRDDTRYLQISAPVQPGNSGGPVLDQSGNVVGMVVSKLDVAKIFEATEDVPQNVNFAIKTSILTNFLDANRVTYVTGTAGQPLQRADLAERAKSMAVLIRCAH